MPTFDESPSGQFAPLGVQHPATNAGRGSVLVVDDEPMVANAVGQMLARSGYVVRTAAGPVEADLEFTLADGAFDLLLTDIVMPDGGGRRLAERLRERAPGLRVLFMSGFTEHDSVRDERELPAPLLTKPFSAARLEAAVQRALGRE
jgi:two-component system cell cycle sensor histidine kinase/response regulator CckA